MIKLVKSNDQWLVVLSEKEGDHIALTPDDFDGYDESPANEQLLRNYCETSFFAYCESQARDAIDRESSPTADEHYHRICSNRARLVDVFTEAAADYFIGMAPARARNILLRGIIEGIVRVESGSDNLLDICVGDYQKHLRTGGEDYKNIVAFLDAKGEETVVRAIVNSIGIDLDADMLQEIESQFASKPSSRLQRFMLHLKEWRGETADSENRILRGELKFIEQMLQWAQENTRGVAYKDFVRRFLTFWGISEPEIDGFLFDPDWD